MTEKYSKDEVKSIKIGFVVAAAIMAVSLGFTYLKKDVENVGDGQIYPLKATFGRTDGLLVGDKVRMAGLDIGRISNAELDGKFHAILTMDINDNVKIPDDSSASIVSSGIMGPKYIEVEPGGSEDFLPVNGEFSYTQDAMVLEELVERIIGMGKSKLSGGQKEEMQKLEENVNM